ncbi:HEAT repeat domain-containing protein [Halorubellus sp. JP-L1]|uniref:HEAT repeat domain-containing protein n=1 Tax=Halorubellus sp. JP-L1 TaxID=2715753 RepID=UPI001409017E|nr:HEAT repeat domain-containing protein [Halorubellus sp. JP-L1]NHN42955.1 HEAT repeat domain-containing protein [Halorubellus sp. JP-L1]
MTYVFAFDRDWTVDVNPHPRHEAVPLEWVRYLAHDTEHAVYAIGNQDLADEAAIPGGVDVVGRYDDDWDDWLGDKQPDGRYERFPKRRERLALIEDIHPDAEGYVVVDDLDLGDVDGWQHYHAWEFVPALERGEFDRDLPWVDAPRDVRTDGGTDAPARIASPDAEVLAQWLDAREDDAQFELASPECESGTTQLLHDVSIRDRSMNRPAAAPAIECVPVAPTMEAFTLRVDDVRSLTVADPPRELYTASARTKREKLRGLRRLATASPEAVPVEEVTVHLDTANTRAARRDALVALREAAGVQPVACEVAVPAVRSELALDDPVSARDELLILDRVAEVAPESVAPCLETVVEYLDGEDDAARGRAASVVSHVAEADGRDIVDAVPALVGLVGARGRGLAHAVYALTAVSKVDLDALAPHRETLAGALADDALEPGVRANALSALGRLVGDDPSRGVDLVDDVAGLLDADHDMLRNNALGFLGDVAKHHGDVVEPYVDELARLASADDDVTRVNASGAIARVAEDDPDAAVGKVPVFIDRLTDENPLVRQNACEVLGHAGASFVTPLLETRAREDENPEVRSRAARALDQLDANDAELEPESST